MSANVGRHANRDQRPRPPGIRPEIDRAQQIAANLQQTRGSWLIIWSRWRRKYTGFACFTHRPVIVDEEKVDRFLARLKEVEQAHRAEPAGS